MRALLILCALLLSAATAIADIRPTPSPPVIGATSYLLVDVTTGHELAALQPDNRVPPASLTKLMTSYVVFQSLKSGQITLDDEVTISEKAWRMQGSRMFIEVGKRVRVEDLLMGVIVSSGNDASVALAEYVAGSEDVFAALMNQYAARLGMTGTNFMNATGLPDPNHYVTARDIAKLAQAIITEFPEYYEWYSTREFTWNDIKQPNRNRLLWRDNSVDGLKTGHTNEAGYCLVSSAERDGMRIVSVVVGTSSDNARINGSQSLINYGFRFFETRLVFKAGEEITRSRVWKAENDESRLGVADDLYLTFPRGAYDALEPVESIPAEVIGPISQGQPVGELTVSLDGTPLSSVPLRALDDNPEGGFWKRTVDGMKLWID
ncbi:MAG: D-alanyl-D-alanine carboxypeptidase family protein [Pseudomonadota bacterium]